MSKSPVKKIILEGGSTPMERGIFSFVIQFISVHRHYFYGDVDYKISFDLRNSAYGDNDLNHWDLFFNQENFNDGERTIWGDGGNIYGYDFDFSDTQERKKASEIIEKRLHLSLEITDRIKKFQTDFFEGKKILGVHKRGTDIVIHHGKKDINKYFELIDQVIKEYDAIYLASDDKQSVDFFKEKYDNVINTSYSTSSDCDLPNFKTPGIERHKMGIEAIIDSYLLSKTDLLIRPNSNLSNFSLLLNPELKFITI